MLKDALGNYRGSLRELDRIVDEEPNNAEAYYDRANARNRAGNKTGAISDYTLAIEFGLRPRERFLALGNRGLVRADLEDIEGAIDDFTAIITAGPKNKGILKAAFINRALLKRKKGDVNGADLDYQEALSIRTTTNQGE